MKKPIYRLILTMDYGYEYLVSEVYDYESEEEARLRAEFSSTMGGLVEWEIRELD